jgi:cytochrome P450
MSSKVEQSARRVSFAVKSRLTSFRHLHAPRWHALRDGLPRLPPGKLQRDEKALWTDDRFLMRQAAQYGPIFKTAMYGRMVICVADHQRSRSLLKEHANQLSPVDQAYNALIEGGFLRVQTGDVHQANRRAILRALRQIPFDELKPILRRSVVKALSEFGGDESHEPTGADLDKLLFDISTDMLLLILFGVRSGHPCFGQLRDAYRQLGPTGFVHDIGQSQQEAFGKIKVILEQLAKGQDSEASSTEFRSVLSDLVSQFGPTLNACIIGNLIYMAEMGRFDLSSLFNWIIKQLSDNAQALIELQDPERSPGLALAAVKETLRLVQSESISRQISQSFAFDGFGFPEGAYVRALMREGHRNRTVFQEPDRFVPSRFQEQSFGPNEYSPFGFDHHSCPAGELIFWLGTIFVEELTSHFEWEVLADGPPIHRSNHWRPAAEFAIVLKSKPVS